MEIDKFRSVVSQIGISKTNNWVCRVYPPPTLTSMASGLHASIRQGGNRVNVNLPNVDLPNAFDLNQTFGLGNSAISVGTNLSLPTLGFTLGGASVSAVRGMDALNLFTQSCTIQGRDIQNFDHTVYGEQTKYGHNHIHHPLNIGYYCGEQMVERDFFEQWQNVIFNPITKQTGYYDDYIGMIEIHKYNSDWTSEMGIWRYNKAYPTRIGDIALGHQAELVRLDISFNYKNYERIK